MGPPGPDAEGALDDPFCSRPCTPSRPEKRLAGSFIFGIAEGYRQNKPCWAAGHCEHGHCSYVSSLFCSRVVQSTRECNKQKHRDLTKG